MTLDNTQIGRDPVPSEYSGFSAVHEQITEKITFRAHTTGGDAPILLHEFIMQEGWTPSDVFSVIKDLPSDINIPGKRVILLETANDSVTPNYSSALSTLKNTSAVNHYFLVPDDGERTIVIINTPTYTQKMTEITFQGVRKTFGFLNPIKANAVLSHLGLIPKNLSVGASSIGNTSVMYAVRGGLESYEEVHKLSINYVHSAVDMLNNPPE